MLTSGVLADDAAIKTSAGKVHWITISDVTANLTVQINNSADNTGEDVWEIDLLVAVNPAFGFNFAPPIDCSSGIYLDVSTATCKVVVGYD